MVEEGEKRLRYSKSHSVNKDRLMQEDAKGFCHTYIKVTKTFCQGHAVLYFSLTSDSNPEV